jgi:hypothetical protein
MLALFSCGGQLCRFWVAPSFESLIRPDFVGPPSPTLWEKGWCRGHRAKRSNLRKTDRKPPPKRVALPNNIEKVRTTSTDAAGLI